MTGGQRHHVAEHCLSLLLCHLVAVGQRGGEVLEGNGRLGSRLRWGGFLCGGFLGRGGSFLGGRHDDLLRHNDERPVRMPKSVGFAQMYRFGPSGRQAAANPAVVSVSISSRMISQPCEAA